MDRMSGLISGITDLLGKGEKRVGEAGGEIGCSAGEIFRLKA